MEGGELIVKVDFQLEKVRFAATAVHSLK